MSVFAYTALSRGPAMRIVLCFLFCTGCAAEAKLIQERPAGGVVAFPFQKEGDRLSSHARSDALRLIENKCGKTYRIAKEGEIPRVNAGVDRAWRGQMSGDRLWALEFTCQQKKVMGDE